MNSTHQGTALARRAIRNFSSSLVPKRTNRHNQRSWLRMVAFLGNNWIGLSGATPPSTNHHKGTK